MKQLRLWVSLSAVCLMGLPLFAQSYEMDLGEATGGVGGIAGVPLSLSTSSELQGLQAIFEWDSANGTGESLVTGATIADADVVAMRVESNYMVLGVVMDNDGQDGEVIEVGDDMPIATANIRCGNSAGGPFPVSFVDATYAMVGAEPVLDNLVVEGGLSIGQDEGLTLDDGAFSCEAQPDQICIESGGNPDPDSPNAGDPCGDIRVLMTNNSAIEGYVTAICHPSALSLQELSVGQAAIDNNADFSALEVFSNGGTVGVVMDLFSPFDGNTIPPGADQHIATYTYCCDDPPDEGTEVFNLSFCDGILGDPLKDTVLVIGGLSVGREQGLILKEGTFTCYPSGPPPPPPEDCNNGIDDDGDGKVDGDDEECQQMFACGGRLDDDNNPTPLTASQGGEVEVCFFVKSPEDNAAGHEQFDHIQGFSMALTFCCDLTAGSTLDVSDTIVEAIGAEFVTAQADNDPNDGDGCELILGVLVDALPPFDGATIPPLPFFQRVGCVTFQVSEDAACGECCFINFTDGINGTGKVPVKNLISVENISRGPITMDCEVCIEGPEIFYRGDCNFSNMGMGMAVDISDAAAVVSFLFLPGTWKFEPPCLDACDCNDDGRIDLADALCILQYYLMNGAFPPAPGPGLAMTDDPNPNMVRETPPGEDPTDDKLGCEGGGMCP